MHHPTVLYRQADFPLSTEPAVEADPHLSWGRKEKLLHFAALIRKEYGWFGQARLFSQCNGRYGEDILRLAEADPIFKKLDIAKESKEENGYLISSIYERQERLSQFFGLSYGEFHRLFCSCAYDSFTSDYDCVRGRRVAKRLARLAKSSNL